jgi:hypothetical protein
MEGSTTWKQAMATLLWTLAIIPLTLILVAAIYLVTVHAALQGMA